MSRAEADQLLQGQRQSASMSSSMLSGTPLAPSIDAEWSPPLDRRAALFGGGPSLAGELSGSPPAPPNTAVGAVVGGNSAFGAVAGVER